VVGRMIGRVAAKSNLRKSRLMRISSLVIVAGAMNVRRR